MERKFYTENKRKVIRQDDAIEVKGKLEDYVYLTAEYIKEFSKEQDLDTWLSSSLPILCELHISFKQLLEYMDSLLIKGRKGEIKIGKADITVLDMTFDIIDNCKNILKEEYSIMVKLPEELN